ncbi:MULTISPECIES: ATP-binding protein [unclassified Streptomyces]|uniref:ATP-binding protein n=1 Tax=unclassified Streptomyces TaxID=2593676 RepID=UPI0038273227
MKQSAKTLGVVALGAAFAAAAAGTASAAPALPHVGALSGVTAATPFGTVDKALPAAPESSTGQQQKGGTSKGGTSKSGISRSGTTKTVTSTSGTNSDPVTGLLGGLPAGPVASNVSGSLPGLSG